MEIPSYRVVDIDTEEDWKRAELLFQTNIQEATMQQINLKKIFL